MRICIWARPYETYDIVRAVGCGAEKLGIETHTLDPVVSSNRRAAIIKSFDFHVVWSAIYNYSDKIIMTCKTCDIPVVVADSGYLNRESHYSIGIGGINAGADFKNVDSPADRFDALGIDVKSLRTDGEYVLAAGPHRLEPSLQCDRIEWAKQVISKIREHTDKPIVYRPFPGITEQRNPGIEGTELSHKPLEDDLTGAMAIVTHNSNIVIPALVEGIPVFTTGASIADKVAFKDLSLLGNPDSLKQSIEEHETDRLQLLHDLAYAQWNIEEIANGDPLKHLGFIANPAPAKPRKRRSKKAKV
jgi:hypothetical protein